MSIPQWAPSMALYSHLVNNVGGEAGLVLRHQSTLDSDWSPLEEDEPFFYLDWVHNPVRKKMVAIATEGLVINFTPLNEESGIDDQQILVLDRTKAVRCETIFRRWLTTPEGKAALKANGAKTDSVTKVIYQ